MHIYFLYCISDADQTVYYARTEHKNSARQLNHAMHNTGFSRVFLRYFSQEVEIQAWLKSKHPRLKNYQLKPFFTAQLMKPYLIGALDDDPVMVSVCKYCVKDLQKPSTNTEQFSSETILANSCYFCHERRSELRKVTQIHGK